MARREQSNRRFRPGFLSELGFQVRAFAHQLRTEPDAHPGVAFELGRLATHADALGLDLLARVAHDAARELETEGMGLGALRRVATAIRQARGPLRLGPIVIVGGSPAEHEAFRRDRELSAEPVFLFGDLASFASDVHPERPEALVLPLAAPDAIAQVARREGCVVLAHGDLTRSDEVRGALEAGAVGLLEPPLSLGAITRQVRWRGRRRVEPGSILLVQGEGTDGARRRLVDALRRVGGGPVPVDVIAALDATSLARALSTRRPSVVVLLDAVSGRLEELVQFVRAHPLAPPRIAVVGERAPPGAVPMPDGDPDHVAASLLAWTDPVIEGPVDVDRTTGLLTRLGVLEALDRALRRHSRGGQPLAVVLVDVVGLQGAIAEHGPVVARTIRRHTGRLLDEALRRGDAVGELGPGQWLVVLEHCAAPDAEARSSEVLASYEALGASARADTRLLAGIADTSRGAAGLAARAEADLVARLSLA